VKHFFPVAASHHGTVVELMVRTDREVDMGRALGHSRPVMSVLELTGVGGPEGFVFKVGEQAKDVGTRVEGRRLRNKILNLVQAEEGERVILDFSGIEVVSSSFADEFVAKMAETVGHDVWRDRFELRALGPTVNTVIQIALWNRVQR
jgi:hypothetical protein